MGCFKTLLSVGVLLFGVGAAWSQSAHEGTDQAALERVSHDIKFLSSDALQGRGLGTAGLETAAKFIEGEYKKIGLQPAMPDGLFRQTFDVAIGPHLDEDSFQLAFTGPKSEQVTCRLHDDAQPIWAGGTGKVSGGLVFVGYGIKADEHNYDEYAGLDVQGKIVVVIRSEPQQDNPQSVFDGAENSPSARISKKIETAKRAGAAGVILVNDGHTAASDEQDELLTADGFGSVEFALPMVQVKRTVIDKILGISPVVNPNGGFFMSLTQIEKYIDENLEPVSAPLDGWTAKYSASFDKHSAKTSNLIGVLPGEGAKAEEVLIVGAHYDHLGMGEVGFAHPDAARDLQRRRRRCHGGRCCVRVGTAVQPVRSKAETDSRVHLL